MQDVDKWGFDPENPFDADCGTTETDPLSMLIAEEEAMNDTTNIADHNEAVEKQYDSFPTAEEFDDSINGQIAAKQEQLEKLERELVQVRADGKTAYITVHSSTSLASLKDKAEARVVILEKQLDMKRLQDEIAKLTTEVKELEVKKLLDNTRAIDVPMDGTPQGLRVAAIFLTGGINGLRRSLHYALQREPKLQELADRDRKRGPIAGKVYADYQDQLLELQNTIDQMQLILEWATPTAQEYLLNMEQSDFWNPELTDPNVSRGTPVDNATPFD